MNLISFKGINNFYISTLPKKTKKSKSWKSEIKVDWELNSNYSKFEVIFGHL